MTYLRDNYGGRYSVLRDQINREMADRIPPFEKLQTLMSGVERLRKLREERRAWIPRDSHDFTNTWLNTWLVKRLIRPEAQVLSGEIAGNIRGVFVTNLEKATTIYKNAYELEEMRGQSSLIAGVAGISSQVYVAASLEKGEGVEEKIVGSPWQRRSQERAIGKRPAPTNGREGDKRLCWRCGSSSHLSRQCTEKISEDLFPANILCLRCGGRGHIARVCPSSPVPKNTIGEGDGKGIKKVTLTTPDGRSKQVTQQHFKRMRVAYARAEAAAESDEDPPGNITFEVEDDFFDTGCLDGGEDEV
jgi:hypothetical protein